MEKFWETKALHELTHEEWESLCDGCGRCCLHKLQDEETDEVFYTRVACRLLDLETGRCRHYRERLHFIPDCVVLRPGDTTALSWLPYSCAYRLLAEGKPLPAWHPLASGSTETVQKAGVSVCGFAISEEALAEPNEIEGHLIGWPV